MNCRSCGAPIRFIEMDSGAKMPVDPELIKTCFAEGSTEGMVLVTERGKTIRGREVSVTDPAGEQVEGFVPHWSTCTDPKRWKR